MDSTPAALLTQHAHDWYAAIDRRTSRRSYTGRPANHETLGSLREVCERFTPFAGARVQLVERPVDGMFTGIIGSYGRIRGAAHALLVIVDSEVPGSQAAAGYMGQAAVLQATTLRLGSCWIGGAFSASAAQRQATLAPSEKIAAAVALGYPTETYTHTDHSMRFLAGSHKRKPAEQLVEGDLAEWPEWARTGVAAARKAPSAVNRQPWRFSLEDDGRTLTVLQDRPNLGGKLTRTMDCGIAMMHIELGALHRDVRGVWRVPAGDGLVVARFETEAHE